MAKRKKANVDFYSECDDAALPTKIPHRHTDFTTNENGKRMHRTREIMWASPAEIPQDQPPLDSPMEGDVDLGDWMDPAFQTFDATDEPAKRRRTLATDAPLLEWLPKREEYLTELLRLEGRGDVASCHGCIVCNEKNPEALFRCEDCFDIRLMCKSCIIYLHQALPLHRVKRWNGLYFAEESLKDLGLRIQLGHYAGQQCSNPAAAPGDDFVIIHTNGIHRVGLDFCNCRQSQDHHIQLLRIRLFPATTIAPKTAATFEVLYAFQMTSFMSKISGFEYYQALARITNNLGVVPPDRYPAFLRMVREWRHIKLMKRMGRGHDTDGINGTPEGSCAVLCPMCPHPGKNLPENWQSAPPERAWLYTLFVGIDANFRLKRLDVSSDTRDPGLNQGYSFVVEEKKFKTFLKEYGDRMPSEKSTCNNHDAIKSASMRGGQGIASSGVGTIECSRHDGKLPGSVGDLQLGERYLNMDYIFLSCLRQNSPTRVVASYDIACQWSVNITRRCSLYPDNVLGEHQIVYVIPKWHMAAHRLKCHTDFSLYYTPWVGRTDGEAPERGWAASNGRICNILPAVQSGYINIGLFGTDIV
ncbi:hypothetical protein BD779DRAFT_1676149 [Infundibulicybe gibba]|nr:hypothetical protein BD779DRAFT_1676149 [Infundibulicybe gibba]